jgi:DNA anti-recombination protein RmuC
MTAEDRNEVRTIVKEEITQALESHPTKDEMQQSLTAAKDEMQQSLSATRDEMQQSLTATRDEMQQSLTAAKDEMQQSLSAMKDEIVEAMRDMQTEMLRGIERFARGNFSRFHTVETTQADVNTRLGLLEERLLAVELRVPPQL